MPRSYTHHCPRYPDVLDRLQHQRLLFCVPSLSLMHERTTSHLSARSASFDISKKCFTMVSVLERTWPTDLTLTPMLIEYETKMITHPLVPIWILEIIPYLGVSIKKMVTHSSINWVFASTVADLTWVYSLLHELGISLSTPAMYCDNVGSTCLCSYRVFYSRMKHIAINLFWLVTEFKMVIFKLITVLLNMSSRCIDQVAASSMTLKVFFEARLV